MWQPEQDPGAASAGSSASNKAAPGIPAHHLTPSAFQHPLHNPTPFSTFPEAWVIGAAAPPEGPSLPSRASSNLQGSIVHAPSDLLPNGLLTSPSPSTPATQLLKVLVNNRITIAVQDASNNSTTGPVTDSPATSGGPALRPLDSLVLPSPSLLPGGVHSLPTPTSTSSQFPKPIDSYGSRGSPLETASSKDSIPGPNAEQSILLKGPNQAPRPTTGASSNRRTDAATNQHSSRNGNGSGSSGSGVSASVRTVDSSSSGGTIASQFAGSRHPQPTHGAHHVIYGGAAYPHGHSMQQPLGTGFQVSQQPQAPTAPSAAATGSVQQQPNSPTVGYSGPSYYMAQLPPGSVMMGMHPPGGTNAGNGSGSSTHGRTHVGGSSVSGGSREGSAGSSWRASRSGSGAHTGGGSGGSGQGGKLMHPYGAPQQLMQGPMAQDGSAGPYGMPHIPYPVYGMMTAGIVMPQVIPSVVGSPGNVEAHGPLAHQPVHMGPMIMPHGPPMAMGVGHHMHSFPPHGHIGGQHMGMHAHSHMTAHAHAGGYSHPHGPHYHGGPGMGPGYSQLTFSHSLGQPMHPHGPSYGNGRGANSKAMGGNGAAQAPGKVGRSGGGGGGSNIVPGASEANGGMAPGNGMGHGNPGPVRDSPVAGRGRTAGREKAEAKSRVTEQRERKPGNSRAPAIIAQCVADMSALEVQLLDLVRQLTPGEDELAAYQAALSAVRELVEGHWSEVTVHLLGSAANGLSIASSNEIDITVEAPDIAWDDHAGKAAMISELGELASGVSTVATTAEPVGAKPEDALVSESTILSEATDATRAITEGGDRGEEAVAVSAAEAELLSTCAKADTYARAEVDGGPEDGSAPVMTAVSALPKARTPIVKMTVASTQTRVDLTINNLLAICNTALVRDYCAIDPRLRQLALVVKHWARTRCVNDAYRGSLSSYTYVLLCIWLMQQRQPAILPVLQQREPHTYDRTVGPWRCSYNDRIEEVKDFGASNKETLAELLVAFFDHWAWRHDYNGSVVCVRTGGTVPKAAKEWTKRQGNERHLMCIEDPFDLSHDLGRTIDKAAVQVLRREFERAARIFASNPDPLSELLAPLTPEEEAAVSAALQSRRKASKDKDRAKEKLASAAAAAAATGTAAGGSDGITDISMAATDEPAVGSADTAAGTRYPGAGRSSDGQDSEGDDWSGDGQTNHVCHEATDPV